MLFECLESRPYIRLWTPGLETVSSTQDRGIRYSTDRVLGLRVID